MTQKKTPISKKAFQNFSFLTLGKIFGDIFTFLLFITLSRIYGQDGIGEYSLAMALAGFFVAAANFGLYNLSILEMSRYGKNISDYYGEIFLLRLLLTSVALGALILITLILPYPNETKLVIIYIGLYQLIYTLVEGFSAIFVAHERMHITAILEVSFRLILAISGASIALYGGSLVLVSASFPVLAVIHLIITFILVCKVYGIPKKPPSLSYLSKTLRDATPFALFTLLRQISTRVDVLILGLMIGTVAAGIYNVAYRIIFLLLFAPYYAGLSLLPNASRLYQNSQDELAELYQKSTNLIVLIAVPSSFGLWLISAQLVIYIFGEEFAQSVIVLKILSWIICLAFIKSIVGTFLTACDHQHERTRSQWTAAWVNIIGNLVLIPYYGVIGAAVSTLFSEALLVIIVTIRLKKILGWPRIEKRLSISIIGSLAFCGTFYLFPTDSLIIMILLSTSIYTLVLLLFRTIRQNEACTAINYVKSLTKKS